MWLHRFHKLDVEIHYLVQSGFKDRGQLLSSGDDWIELLKDNGETLLVPMSAIRVMKVIDNERWTPSERSPEHTLLRPASGEQTEESAATTVAGQIKS